MNMDSRETTLCLTGSSSASQSKLDTGHSGPLVLYTYSLWG
jgi:hypothetical protein